MNKKKLTFVVLFAFVAITVSCNKPMLGLNTNNPAGITSEISRKYAGRIWIRSATSAMSKQTSANISVHFEDEMKTVVPVGEVKIGPYSLSPNEQGNYSYSPEKQAEIATTAQILKLFGNSIEVSIQGNKNFAAFSREIYLPETIKLDMPNDGDERLIKKGKNFKIEWVPDGQPAYMQIELSTSSDSVEVGGTLPYWTKMIRDKGEFNIPASELARFNASGNVHIILTRYNAEAVKIGEREVAIISSTSHGLGGYRLVD